MTEHMEPPRAISEHGLIALVMMLRFHGIAIDAERIRHQFGGSIGTPEMLRCAKELGLKARLAKSNWARLFRAPACRHSPSCVTTNI